MLVFTRWLCVIPGVILVNELFLTVLLSWVIHWVLGLGPCALSLAGSALCGRALGIRVHCGSACLAVLSLGALDSVDSAPVCALWSSALQCTVGWFRDVVNLVQLFPSPGSRFPGLWLCGVWSGWSYGRLVGELCFSWLRSRALDRMQFVQ